MAEGARMAVSDFTKWAAEEFIKAHDPIGKGVRLTHIATLTTIECGEFAHTSRNVVKVYRQMSDALGFAPTTDELSIEFYE